jgi:hypothetical protein
MTPTLRVILAATPLMVSIVFAAPAPPVRVGAARIDITPELPIHLVGYANRQGEAQEVRMPLHARALALGAGTGRPVVLIAAEVCGITSEITDAVAAALRESHGLQRAEVSVAVTHTHTGPAIRGLLPFSFGGPLPPGQAERVARYTEALQQKLITVARQAIGNLKPGRLDWGEGRATFAVHRRVIENGKWARFGTVADGPVDHALPVLRAADAAGTVRAVFLSYACHCTSNGGANVIHPDWAGEAAARIEAAHPGAVALVGIGCGADAGPVPKGSLAAAAANGDAIAREVARVLGSSLRPLGAVSRTRFDRIELPLDRAVPRAELAERAKSKQRLESYAGKELLRELDGGKPPRTAVPYPVQTWTFGNDLALVLLGGEVVSEYALRLRRELAAERSWIVAYANSVPCYIPSRRMYSEGGYEVDSSIGKYGWPTRLAIGTEDRIVAAVHAALPAAFKARPER